MTHKGCGKKTKSGRHRKHTEVKSKKQRGAMGAALAAKRGEKPVSSLRGPSLQIYKSMSESQLSEHLKESRGKNLPQKVKSKKSKSKTKSGRKK